MSSTRLKHLVLALWNLPILQKAFDEDREGMGTVLKWVLLRWLGWSFGLWSEITVDSAFKR
jgi:hypothetical protein